MGSLGRVGGIFGVAFDDFRCRNLSRLLWPTTDNCFSCLTLTAYRPVPWFPMWGSIFTGSKDLSVNVFRGPYSHLPQIAIIYYAFCALPYPLSSTTVYKLLSNFADEETVTQRDELAKSDLGSQCQTEVWTEVIWFLGQSFYPPSSAVSPVKDSVNQLPGLAENFHRNSWVAVVVVEGCLLWGAWCALEWMLKVNIDLGGISGQW